MIADDSEAQSVAPHPRAARLRLAEAEDYLAHLYCARQHASGLGLDTESLDDILSSARGIAYRYADVAGERIQQRNRFGKERNWRRNDPARNQYMLCIDECGTYHLGGATDRFPVLSLCGVIIHRAHYERLDAVWRQWKSDNLGSPDVIVHEPDVRKRTRQFFRPLLEEQDELLDRLQAMLLDADYTVIAAVIDKQAFANSFGAAGVDDFLPRNHYLMCLDFLLERFVHFLYHRGADGWGKVFAEGRGKLEDARLQHEYIRLQIDGTQFMADQTFRYHLGPTIEFLAKSENHSGLQIADLLARPCAEKVLRPNITPERWACVEPKLYDGCKGAPEKYGLKSFPVRSAWRIFEDIANGGA